MTGAFSFLAKIVYMKSRQLRDDVNWVLNCPDLLQGDGPHLQLGNDALLNLGPLRTTPWKVGRYFEALVAELLINSKTHVLCDSSRQIQLAGQTIGELDFIYLDLDEELTHCETAIKYYLYYPNLNWTGSHFIGPNPHDTFESKTTRLLTHQLPLSQRYYPKVSKRETFVKGIIFYPADHRHPVTIRHDRRETFGPVLSTWRLLRKDLWSAAKLASYYYQCIVEHAPVMQVSQQRG